MPGGPGPWLWRLTLFGASLFGMAREGLWYWLIVGAARAKASQPARSADAADERGD
jgi:hypothetical protein